MYILCHLLNDGNLQIGVEKEITYEMTFPADAPWA
jgi:hypothetical protein